MKNQKFKILKTILRLEKQNILPTIDSINKILKSNFQETDIRSLADDGVLTWSFHHKNDHIYCFHTNIKSLEYIAKTKKSNIIFWVTLLTLFATFVSIGLTILFALL